MQHTNQVLTFAFNGNTKIDLLKVLCVCYQLDDTVVVVCENENGD